MYCPSCGIALPQPPPPYCRSCGARLAAGDATASAGRPGIVTLLAVLQFIGGALAGAVGLACLGLAAAADDATPRTVLLVVGAFLGAIGALQVVCGVGLWKLRQYGRIMQIVFASIGLISFPFGTVIGILILVYLTKPGIALLFSGRPAADFTADEQQQIAAVQGSRGVVIAVVAVGALFFLVIAAAIVAAIAIPGILRARMTANEAAAMSTIRSFQNAEIAYAARNGGLYDTPDCLVTPRQCLPGYAGDGMLDPAALASPRLGYRLRFEPGPPAGPIEAGGRTTVSGTSMASFAVVAVPDLVNTTGSRAFCGDSTGRLCWVTGGMIDASGGSCPAACQAVR
jgi:uncharacterized membrane protein (DUF2068 family)